MANYNTSLLGVFDENIPPPGNLADELRNAGECAFESPVGYSLSMSSADQDSAVVQAYCIADEVQRSHDTGLRQFRDLPEIDTEGASDCVGPECIEDFRKDLSHNALGPNARDSSGSAHDYRSEHFFKEDAREEFGHAFDYDKFADAAHAPDVQNPVPRAASSAINNAPPYTDIEMGYYVPVESLKIREYAFDRPTLLVMRLYYLRQMHILTELGKPEVFNDDDPLIRPILHEPAKFRGLGWAAERGTVGGWVSVGRAEPRYITHFAGRPTLLFAAERAVLSKLSKRAILTIDEMDL